MLENYLKVALRSLRRQPGYSLINVGGLGLGLGCCFLIVLFIQHERSFDGFHENADRLVRYTFEREEGEERYANSAAGYAPLFVENFPEIEQPLRVDNGRSPFVRLPDGTVRKLDGVALADSGFFQAFSFRLLQGDPATVLDERRSIVLTESVAEAFFGDENAVGQVVQDGERTLTVTGVMEDVPENSHFIFKAVVPFTLLGEIRGEDELTGFTNYNYTTYFLLLQGTDPAALSEKMTALMRERHNANRDPDDEPSTYASYLQPLSEIYFTTGLRYDQAHHRNPRYLWTFGAIGLLILLIACVNFMNLATARAAQRAREVGVRKAIGAYRKQLVAQFLGESVLLSVLAIVVGIVLAVAALPLFNEALDASTRFEPTQVLTLLLLVGIGLGAGLVAGSYPAFYLSAFRPARVLKGESDRGSGGAAWLRKGLIVFQFAISAFLIVATLTIYDQLQYMQNRDLGFEKEQVLFVRPPTPIWDSFEAFEQELKSSPQILHVAKAGGLPGRVGTSRGYYWPGQGEEEQTEGFWTAPAGPGYLDVLGIDLVAGRGFSDEITTDTLDTYVLNEKAVAEIGLTPEEAVGATFRAWDRPEGQIIGVVADYHFQSLHQEVEPLVLNYIPWFGYVALRIAPGDYSETLEHVQATWQKFAPGYAFDYTFLDEDFDRLYRDEARLGKLFGFFAGVAIFIACLGLFGLAAFTAERRRKEIGVRKVLGASAGQIVTLLAKDFARLVLVGFVVAVPFAWFAVGRWLESFAYRVGLGPDVFLLAGAIALVIALVTVSSQALRAASTDPVKALRTE